jgi:hypothetical protein
MDSSFLNVPHASGIVLRKEEIDSSCVHLPWFIKSLQVMAINFVFEALGIGEKTPFSSMHEA